MKYQTKLSVYAGVSLLAIALLTGCGEVETIGD